MSLQKREKAALMSDYLSFNYILKAYMNFTRFCDLFKALMSLLKLNNDFRTVYEMAHAFGTSFNALLKLPKYL